jgi:methylmalonyl-CoA/ethylmalonyl-CoA epimerase
MDFTKGQKASASWRLPQPEQLGFVVRSIDEAIPKYSEIYGVTFPTIVVPEYFNRTYRGEKEDFRMKIALGRLGGLEVELIEHLEGRTVYRDFLERGGEGFHHLGVEVPDFDGAVRALQARGIAIIQSGERTGARFAYMDTEKTFGTVIEFFRREKRL